jgi:hypothetical protein
LLVRLQGHPRAPRNPARSPCLCACKAIHMRPQTKINQYGCNRGINSQLRYQQSHTPRLHCPATTSRLPRVGPRRAGQVMAGSALRRFASRIVSINSLACVLLRHYAREEDEAVRIAQQAAEALAAAESRQAGKVRWGNVILCTPHHPSHGASRRLSRNTPSPACPSPGGNARRRGRRIFTMTW